MRILRFLSIFSVLWRAASWCASGAGRVPAPPVAIPVEPSAAAGAADKDVLSRAMRQELKRSFEKLKNAEPARLYYLDYEVYDTQTYDLVAGLGAIRNEWETHRRTVDVGARVGSPRLDNTHELRGGDAFFRGAGPLRSLPIDGDEMSLRAGLWLATEEAYREAQERFAKVQTNRAVKAEEEDRSGDFSEEGKPESLHAYAEFPAFSRAAWKDRVERYSKIFKDYEFIQDSYVQLSVQSERRDFASSEGADLGASSRDFLLTYYLATHTADGMDLWRFEYYEGGRLEDLPSDEDVRKDIARSIVELKALREAPLAEPYSGPVILKNRAAGVFFHEALGHRVEGQRQKSEHEGQTFKRKLGEKITSENLSVYDDPTLDRYRGRFLAGHYPFDDQGIRSQRVPVVEKGVLKNFLMDRNPIDRFPRSNGHGRREAGRWVEARQGNLIVEAERTVPYDELRRQLIAEVRRLKKPYGLVFEDIEGGHTATMRDQAQAFHVLPLLVYRVYPDGRPDQVVRGVNIVGTPLTVLGKILAAGDDAQVENGRCGSLSGTIPVSMVAPSILISEMEVEKAAKSHEKPPILKPPLYDRDQP